MRGSNLSGRTIHKGFLMIICFDVRWLLLHKRRSIPKLRSWRQFVKSCSVKQCKPIHNWRELCTWLSRWRIYTSTSLTNSCWCHVHANAGLLNGQTDIGFQWVAECCNLMGSAKFRKLVDANKWDKAMEVCIAQCDWYLQFQFGFRSHWWANSTGQFHEDVRDWTDKCWVSLCACKSLWWLQKALTHMLICSFQ